MPDISIRQHKLENGLRVVICPDHGAPVVNVTVMYAVGSHDEHPGITGFAHLFEHLMFDNNSSGSSKQYDTLCIQAGGTNNAYTSYNNTTYYITLPSHQLALGLWLESERMRTFAINHESLETQRSVVLEEIKQNVDNQPYGRMYRVQATAAFQPASSYSWEVYGAPEDIAVVTLDQAKDFYNTYYNPANAVLCISGDVNELLVLQEVERYFGDIARGTTDIHRAAFSTDMRRFGTHETIKDTVSYPAVLVSFHVPGFCSSTLMAEEILTSAIGQGRSSPLHRELVKNRRVASSAGAYLDQREHTSLLTLYAYAADSSASADTLYEELMDVVSNFKYSATHHDTSVNRLRTSLAHSLQRNSGVADLVAWSTLFLNNPNYANEASASYKEVNLDDVADMAQRVFLPLEATRVDVVPE